jgi:hypothetical protein
MSCVLFLNVADTQRPHQSIAKQCQHPTKCPQTSQNDPKSHLPVKCSQAPNVQCCITDLIAILVAIIVVCTYVMVFLKFGQKNARHA